MKQIGSRQESSIIGGIGTCGRELCCSTWKSNFETVTTTAARYQNLAINQTKLTGQCGRLKCCLNYELDTYIDALGDFPDKADVLKLEGGKAQLIKTDIFKGIMYYSIQKENFKGPLVAISKEKVKMLLEMNKKGKKIEDLASLEEAPVQVTDSDEFDENIELDFADVTGEIELPDVKRRRKSRRNKRKPGNNRKPQTNKNKASSNTDENKKPQGKSRRNKSNRNRNNKGNNSNKKDN
jgi:hypothetical protein